MRNRLRIYLLACVIVGLIVLAAAWWFQTGIQPRTVDANATRTANFGKTNHKGLLYLYPSIQPASLFLIIPDSEENLPLIQSNAGVIDYTIQTDGKVLFVSIQDRKSGSTIYRADLSRLNNQDQTNSMKADPGEIVLEPIFICENAVCRGLAVAPNNDLLAFEQTGLPGSGRPEYPQVWILPLTEDDEIEPFSAGNPNNQTEQPQWSRSGLLGYYDHSDNAYIFSKPKGQVFGRFSNQVGEGGVWQPDGKAFLAPEITDTLNMRTSPELSSLVPLADSHLMLYHLETQKVENLTPGQGIEDASPAYSPLGDYLVFGRKYLDAQRWTPGRQIWIARTDNREARALTDSPDYNHFNFAWSSDGYQLAYMRFNQSEINQPPEIWIYDLVSGRNSQVMVGGFQPRWLP